MPRTIFSLIALLLAWALPAAADPAIGSTHRDLLKVAGKQIPLPEGNWVLAGLAHTQLPPKTGPAGAYGSILNMVLLKAAEDGIEAIVEINTNTLPVDDGWGISRHCERQDLHLVLNRYRSGYDAACVFIGHSNPVKDSGQASQAWGAARTMAQRRRLSLPSEFVTVGFRVADRADLVDLRVSFDPRRRGLAPTPLARWPDSAWHPTRVAADEARMAYLAGLSRWAATFVDSIEQGMKNALAEGEKPPAPFADDNEVSPQTVRRLQELVRLFETGAIGAEEFERQSTLVLSGQADQSAAPIDPGEVALWKTISYRPMVSTANLFIDYMWIGQPFAAGVLVLLQVVVNTTKFYFHELAWNKYVGGAGGKREAAPVLDFPQGQALGP
jgi:uncharacterized membrane protein